MTGRQRGMARVDFEYLGKIEEERGALLPRYRVPATKEERLRLSRPSALQPVPREEPEAMMVSIFLKYARRRHDPAIPGGEG